MDHRKRLISVAVLLLLSGSSVYAGYANVSPPLTWDHVPVERGGRLGQMGVRVAANDSVLGGVVRASERVAVNVGGRSVTMPVAYRVASNAAAVASRFAFGSPALMVGAGIAAAAYYYYNDKGFSIVIPNNAPPFWAKDVPQFEGYYFTLGTVVSSVAEGVALNCSLYGQTGCYAVPLLEGDGWAACYHPSGFGPDEYRCLQNVLFIGSKTIIKEPASENEFNTAFGNSPLPDELLSKLPIPLPVDDPVLNPSPGAEPLPQPMRVPQGDPVPVPNSVPPQWRSPALDIVPSPSIDEPWRVDLQPVDVVKTTPDKLPETYTIPADPLPDPDTQVKPKPESEQGICLLFPDILACAKPKLDIPEGPEIQRQNMDVTITPDSGWGGGGGSCPAPRHINGANVEFSFQPLCDGISKFRPLILAFAWLSAAFILVGIRQGNDV